MDLLGRTFGACGPVIAILQLPWLPGRPWHGARARALVEARTAHAAAE